MGNDTNVQEHTLKRIILPDTPHKDRTEEDKQDEHNRPPTFYACSCIPTTMDGATSRRQARRLHKEHRMDVLVEGVRRMAEKLGEIAK